MSTYIRKRACGSLGLRSDTRRRLNPLSISGCGGNDFVLKKSQCNRYFLDRSVGAGVLSIYGIHSLDTILFVHGELQPGYTTLLGNFRPQMHLIKSDGTKTTETYANNSPDQIVLTGRFATDPPAVFAYHLRAGNRFKDTPGMTWRVYGDRAEMLIEFAGASPHIGNPSKIQICDGETGDVENVKVDHGAKEWSEMGAPGENIGRLYEAYAKGEGYADWEAALKRHELVEEFYAGGTW